MCPLFHESCKLHIMLICTKIYRKLSNPGETPFAVEGWNFRWGERFFLKQKSSDIEGIEIVRRYNYPHLQTSCKPLLNEWPIFQFLHLIVSPIMTHIMICMIFIKISHWLNVLKFSFRINLVFRQKCTFIMNERILKLNSRFKTCQRTYWWYSHFNGQIILEFVKKQKWM